MEDQTAADHEQIVQEIAEAEACLAWSDRVAERPAGFRYLLL